MPVAVGSGGWLGGVAAVHSSGGPAALGRAISWLTTPIPAVMLEEGRCGYGLPRGRAPRPCCDSGSWSCSSTLISYIQHTHSMQLPDLAPRPVSPFCLPTPQLPPALPNLSRDTLAVLTHCRRMARWRRRPATSAVASARSAALAHRRLTTSRPCSRVGLGGPCSSDVCNGCICSLCAPNPSHTTHIWRRSLAELGINFDHIKSKVSLLERAGGT